MEQWTHLSRVPPKSSMRPSRIRIQATRQDGAKLNFDSTNQLFVSKISRFMASASVKHTVLQNEGLIELLKWVHCFIAPRRPGFSPRLR
jgi:hypothetical protein